MHGLGENLQKNFAILNDLDLPPMDLSGGAVNIENASSTTSADATGMKQQPHSNNSMPKNTEI